ncbi:N-formylglutamate amidohydrolase [Fulvivirga lutimaris]|uniref:N-formylglutamate amidohydrolase n=1 Tax=Fulvivirga lutimaris TaxID=1819566 RepID=UPI0012BBE554|nr:N-formylglutamate amidohydrolase [Fulvivirga lutimaris]MTI39678.1 N-formylglutamate deformylase [Fulvivirga lutimaris]
MQIAPFNIIQPKSPRVPVLISVPHCGVQFPDEIKNNYNQDLIAAPDDTDWFVHQLYDFASEMGITMIRAEYSRWVIDLNRDPDSQPLYDDGRIITALTPTTTFAGENIYLEGKEPDQAEVNRRLEVYYWPYYHKIQSLLDDLKAEFSKVLFWDSHSIRQYVPTIRKENFPDLILGDNDQKSANIKLSEAALVKLRESSLQVNHNTPFKGGHLTRYFGKPNEAQHGLQLEMTKINYMDDDEMQYDSERAEKMRTMLKSTFSSLLNVMDSL